VSTQKLDVKKNWPSILHNAALRVADFAVDEDGDEDDGDEDPRAMIVICKSPQINLACHTHQPLHW
jgi:hypothetical protein